MSYTSPDPEKTNRDPDTSSLASTSTSASQLSKSSKKSWSKFKSSFKSLGKKMSSKPTFAEPTESSERKKSKKNKKNKEGTSTSEVKPSEEKPREKSPSKGAKGLIKKLSVDTISTPFVGYQPSSVSPTRTYAKALYKSPGSTSESNLSVSDLDSPKKSSTLDKNTKYMMSSQESTDSGRESRMMESSASLGESRPPSQITGSATSDLSVDSDYATPVKIAAKEGSLVAKTAHFAQSVIPPKQEKEKDANVSMEFIRSETTMKQPDQKEKSAENSKSEFKEASRKKEPNQKDDDPQKRSSLTENKKAEIIPESAGRDELEGRKKGKQNSALKSDTSTADFIKSEQTIFPIDSTIKSSQKQESGKNTSSVTPLVDTTKEKTDKKSSEEKPKQQTKVEKSQEEDKSVMSVLGKKEVTGRKNHEKEKEENKSTNDKEETKPKESDTSKGTSKNVAPETSQTEDKNKTVQDTKTSSVNGMEKDPKSDKSTNPEVKDESKKISSKETTSKSKTPSTTLDVTSDFGPSTPGDQKTSQMTVEEKLEAFLSAEGWSGTLKGPISDKATGDGSQQSDRRECLYKILVIGELGTGKTSIIKRYVHQFFSQHYRATIGVDFALKVLNWDANTIIRLQLWDIAGQERFGNMTRVYYKEAVGAFIVFDVTRSGTFDAVLKWKQDLDSKVQLADGSPIPCVLLANKCDQQKEGIVNTPSKMEEYCKENNFSAWFETSAKENINIDEAAKSLVSQILQNDKMSQNGRDSARDGTFPLDKSAEEQGRSCAC